MAQGGEEVCCDREMNIVEQHCILWVVGARGLSPDVGQRIVRGGSAGNFVGCYVAVGGSSGKPGKRVRMRISRRRASSGV